MEPKGSSIGSLWAWGWTRAAAELPGTQAIGRKGADLGEGGREVERRLCDSAARVGDFQLTPQSAPRRRV